MTRLFRALVALAALTLMLAVLLSYAGPVIHAIDLLAHFRLHLLALCAPVGLAAIIARDGWAFWRATIAAVIAAAGLAPIWESPAPAVEGRRLVVMTANLFQKNEQPDEMLATLRRADPDILVTQETTKSVNTGPHPLTDLFDYRLSLTTRGQTLRTVIWSKFPMRKGELHLNDRVEPTGAHALIQIGGGIEVSVLGLHLAHAFPGNQARQIEALGDIVPALPEPRIIMGDFNAEPWSHAMKQVEALTGTRRIPGYRVTWRGIYPTPLGLVPAPFGHAIDHILVTPGIGVESIGTVEIPGSDHLGVRAVLRVPDT